MKPNRSSNIVLESLESRRLLAATTPVVNGLTGQYFDNKDFTNLKLTRVDPQINFTWGTGSPDPSIGADTFSVRWSGQVLPDTTATYKFYTTTDDGVRLWVNDQLVIDKLVNQPATSYTSAGIKLTAGQAVDVRMDYYDNTGSATAKLFWSTGNNAKSLIPTDHLFAGSAPSDPTIPQPPPPPPPPPPPTTLPGTIRIDAAGTQNYTDANGIVWSKDMYYSGGSSSLGALSVEGTSDGVMWYTRRCGKSFSYAIPVAPGEYTLNLMFADESYNVGGRLFNVSAEGTKILSNFDIAAIGKNLAVTESFNVFVGDGTLNLQFAGVLNNATISAIEVIPQTTIPPISWQTVAPSPVVRAEALGKIVNGKLYVFGGFDNDSAGDILAQYRVDVYDPATNTWTQLNDEPEAITHAGVVVDGTNIWFVGAYVGNHPGPGTSHVWEYDTLTDTWTRGPDLPEARGAGAAALVGRELHFFGGMDMDRTIDEGTHWALDLDNLDAGWQTLATMPNPRNHIAAAVVDGKIYAIGGQYNQESLQVAQSEVDMYDPATDMWTKVAALPQPRSHANMSTFVMNDKIVVLGGEIGYNQPQSTIYEYDPTQDAWSLIGLLPANRSTSVAGVLPEGTIITSTGNSPNPTVDTWIGTLPTDGTTST